MLFKYLGFIFMKLREENESFNKEKKLYYQELVDQVIVDPPYKNTNRVTTALIINE